MDSFRNWRTPLVAWLCVFLAAGPSAAWGPEGHIVVGKIAELHLTSKTRTAIAELLSNRPLSNGRVVNWADYIKSSATYERKYPKHRTWHYIDIPLELPAAEFKPELLVNGRPADHVVARIEHFKKIMIDPAVAKDDRKEALFFLVHFVGDFHQPLHCCERDDDQGGNLQKIASYDDRAEERLNLHWVWDGKLVQHELGVMTPEDYAVRIDAALTDSERVEMQKGGAKDWAWDSHMVAVAHVYKFADSKLPFPSKDEPPIALTRANYIEPNGPVVRRQLQKAGTRLAKVLNDAFDPPQPAAN